MNTRVPAQTILIVEDDAAIRLALQEALESEGYLVTTATNGREGLARIREAPCPSLVLLDFMMPVMSGREFLDVVAGDSALAGIPVIVVSASVGSQSTLGAAQVLKKPIDLDLLLQVIRLKATAA